MFKPTSKTVYKIRLKVGDNVIVRAGKYKGKTGKVLATWPKANAVTVEGIGEFKRRIKPTKLNPQVSHKDIHRPLDVSKVALVHPTDSTKTTRIGFSFKKDGSKVRVARQAENKEITS